MNAVITKKLLWVVLVSSIVLASIFQVISPNIEIYEPDLAWCYDMQEEGLRIGCPSKKYKVGFYHEAVPTYDAKTWLLNLGFYGGCGLLLVAGPLLWQNKHKH